jgi:ribosomal protein L30/L7E
MSLSAPRIILVGSLGTQFRIDWRRNAMKARAGAVGLLAALVLSVAPWAMAEETECTGALGAVTVDNLRVPEGETCTLSGTLVRGTVKVETDATLKALGVRVIGNVQAKEATKVVVRDNSKVGGSIQVVQGESAKVLASRIKGDILYDEQIGKLKVNDNRIGGQLQAFANEGQVTMNGNEIEGDLQAFENAGGPLAITDNEIDGNLQCKENEPPPTGGGNIVQGNKEDQCAAL